MLYVKERIFEQALPPWQHLKEKNVYLYCLWDRARAGMNTDNILTYLPVGQSVSLFEGTPEAAYDHIAPYLVNIPSPEWYFSTPSGRAMLALESEHTCLSWLWSPWPIETLAFHLQQFMQGRLKSGHGVLVRLYDPAVLRKLLSLYQETELKALLTPITEWWLWDEARNKRWVLTLNDKAKEH